MKKILFITLYDKICIGPRLLSSLAKKYNVEPHLLIFKDQKGRPILRDVKDNSIYQWYDSGIKHTSCYAALPYTDKEVRLLLSLIKSINPALIGLSTRSFAHRYCKEIFSKVRGQFDIPIIGGGWGPTLEPEAFLDFCDYVCFGEGEKSFVEICNEINNGNNTFQDVSNLMYFENGRLHKNHIVEPLDSGELNDLPFPDFESDNKYMIDDNKVYYSHKFYNENIYNCFAGRGCPLNCTYCMSSKYRMLYREHGYAVKKYRVREVDTVIKELGIAKKKGAKFIRIADEVFPINKEWVYDFLEKYKKEVGLPFFAYIRPEFHDVDIIKEMVASGLFTTTVGIQSGADYVRKKIFKRSLPKEKIVEFAKILRDLNVTFKYDLINFNPFEKEGHMQETLELLYRLPYAPLSVFRIVVFPGSPFSEMVGREEPRMESEKTQKWYGYLYTMTLKNKFYRTLGRRIFERKLFRKNLLPFVVLFLPSLFRITYDKCIRKIRYGSATVIPLPVKKERGDCIAAEYRMQIL